jgi:predicted RNase H-like nuclease (RuvC/YqgF family)
MNCEYCGTKHNPDPFVCIARMGEQIAALVAANEGMSAACKSSDDHIDACEERIRSLESVVREKEKEIEYYTKRACCDPPINQATYADGHIDECRERKLLDVVRGQFTQICSYCGEEMHQPNGWNELQAHIKMCPKHPLTRARDQIAALTADLKIANGGINTLDELIERKDKTISILTAENEKYREALEDIAKQRIKKELTPAERDNADYEYGFEYTVENARKTLEPSEPEHECEYEMGHCVICGKDMSGFRQTEGGGR